MQEGLMATALATPRARLLDPARVDGIGPPRRSNGSGLTLGERLEAVVDAVRTGAPAECPVCAGSMARRGGVAVCRDCGARLG
jgi:hypothetical protein